MPTMNIESDPLILTDDNGDPVLTVKIVRTANGSPQTQFVTQNGSVAMAIGGERIQNDLQFHGAYDKPRVGFIVHRPNGSTGDVWMQASVIVGTPEACTKTGDQQEIGTDDGLKADPAGSINICRTTIPSEPRAAMFRLYGKFADGEAPREVTRFGYDKADTSKPLRFYQGFGGSDLPRFMVEHPTDASWSMFRIQNAHGNHYWQVNPEGRLVYEDHAGTSKIVAP